MKFRPALIVVALIIWISHPSFSQKFYNTACDSILNDTMLQIIPLDEHRLVHTYAERSWVYCSPHLKSEKVGHLPFNTKLNCLEDVTVLYPDSIKQVLYNKVSYRKYNRPVEWVKISYQTNVSQFGYVLKTDLADEYIPDIPAVAKLCQTNHERTFNLKLVSSNQKQLESIDEIKLPYLHGKRFTVRKDLALTDCSSFLIYETFRMSCPGTLSLQVIGIHQNGFTPISNSHSSGEANLFDSETNYLPVKLKNGEIKLVPDGMLMQTKNFDDKVGYPYPDEVGVPISSLIIKTRTYTEEVLDANGELIEDDHHNFKVNIVEEEPEMYFWNKNEMNKLGPVHFLNLIEKCHTKKDTVMQEVLAPLLEEEKNRDQQSGSTPLVTDSPSQQNYLLLLLFFLLGTVFSVLITFIIKNNA